MLAPLGHHTLKLKVTFCVRGVMTPPWGTPRFPVALSICHSTCSTSRSRTRFATFWSSRSCCTVSKKARRSRSTTRVLCQAIAVAMYCPRVLGQWFDGIRFYAAASSPTRSRRTWAGLSIVVFLQHPLFVVCPLEREQGQAEFLDGREAPHPQQILLQRADEALRDAVAFGLPHEARGTFDAEERDLLLKIVGQVVRPVVVTQPQPTGHAFADAPEAFADGPWRIGSRASKRVPRLAA